MWISGGRQRSDIRDLRAGVGTGASKLRSITVEMGTNVLAGTRREGILEGVRESMVKAEKASVPPKWDGKAAERIWEAFSEVRCQTAEGERFD